MIDREEQRQRAFGMLKGPKKSEAWEQKKIATWLRENHPEVRFYSTLDGYYLGANYGLYESTQWFERGVPDLFVYVNNGTHTMLVIELKKEGVKITKRNGDHANQHVKEQAGWLEYFRQQGARAEFCIGHIAAIELIIEHINYGKDKSKNLRGRGAR